MKPMIKAIKMIMISVCMSINTFVVLSVKKVLKLKPFTELHTNDIQTIADLFLHGTESGTGALDTSIS